MTHFNNDNFNYANNNPNQYNDPVDWDAWLEKVMTKAGSPYLIPPGDVLDHLYDEYLSGTPANSAAIGMHTRGLLEG